MSSATLPLPFPLPLPLTLRDLLSGRVPAFGSLMLMRWEVMASRVGGASEGETALASSEDPTPESLPMGGTSTVPLWSDGSVASWKCQVQSQSIPA